MKKFLIKNLCFCCGVGLYDMENRKKTTVPVSTKAQPQPPATATAQNGNVKQQVSENGTSTKQTYVNGAFRTENTAAVTRESLKESRDRSSRHFRQISDISAFFRLPQPDEKSLSDLVIEEYDNKTKTLRSGGSEGLGQRTSSSSSIESNDEESINHDDLETTQDRQAPHDVTEKPSHVQKENKPETADTDTPPETSGTEVSPQTQLSNGHIPTEVNHPSSEPPSNNPDVIAL